MRRRILRSTLLVVAATALLLGLPLLLLTRALVEDITRADLVARLDRVAVAVVEQQSADGRLAAPLSTASIALAVPEGARLDVTYRDADGALVTEAVGADGVGAGRVRDPIQESVELGGGERLVLRIPGADVRTAQLQAMTVVALVVALSVAGGAVVATVTARRLAGPLQEVAQRAAQLGAGDFRPVPRRHGVVELDRVSDVLDSSAGELAELVQRERQLVGDLSHQLRSRLTAVRLRLDELAEHDDPAVVEEAAAGMAQVDRLTEAVAAMVRDSRQVRTGATPPVEAISVVTEVVAEWLPVFSQAGRTLRLLRLPETARTAWARATPSRLREAVAVLVENALVHGGGAVTVTVTLTPARDPAGAPTVMVEVADGGAGVAAELVAHVFERGVSGANSSGVGLALARALAETDGGRLELRRARPALFTLFLAAAAGPPRAPELPAREPR